MTIHSDTGLIEWTPDNIGPVNVTVRADNGVAPSPTFQSFTVEVQGPPLCPSDVNHYWMLDEISSGKYIDFYGTTDAICSASCPAVVTGKINGAQQFNGTSSVNVPDDNSFDWSGSDSFSVELWMKTNSSSTCSGTQVFVGRDDGSTYLHWWVGCRGDGSRCISVD
jgi:hypothetical protein